jgi:succinate dehydrogenase / fumarate reductase iron-sulfur subunit
MAPQFPAPSRSRHEAPSHGLAPVSGASSNGPLSRARAVRIRLRRQDRPATDPRWEDFDVPYRKNLNVIACLESIAANPVTADGQATTTPVWDSGCLNEQCGACAMLINGSARMACSALIDDVSPDGEPITLEPLSKFPLIRDLYVNRGRLFDDLKRVKAWVPIDGTHDLGPGPPLTQDQQQRRYPLSRCVACACCLEACPQYLPQNSFVGAAVIAQGHLFDDHPTGATLKDHRLEVLIGEGGVHNCSKAGNCVQVCPKDIPLLEAIARVQRDANWFSLRKLLGF